MIYLQLFAFIAFAAASLLIVFHVYVPDVDDPPPEARYLKRLGRIAIWDKERIIILISILVWLVNFSLLLEGSYLLQIMKDSFMNLVTSQVPYE